MPSDDQIDLVREDMIDAAMELMKKMQELELMLLWSFDDEGDITFDFLNMGLHRVRGRKDLRLTQRALGRLLASASKDTTLALLKDNVRTLAFLTWGVNFSVEARELEQAGIWNFPVPEEDSHDYASCYSDPDDADRDLAEKDVGVEFLMTWTRALNVNIRTFATFLSEFKKLQRLHIVARHEITTQEEPYSHLDEYSHHDRWIRQEELISEMAKAAKQLLARMEAPKVVQILTMQDFRREVTLDILRDQYWSEGSTDVKVSEVVG
ncbi:hypothetical protein M011DRAFT_477839 [Sporormia fimetaria CBS 119925]|uniref:Uncharacterized protein n=1 Tax=Sporormia fimetaria CBS 119925 TaxID=1340428 RepID=A0A6A6VBD3_9PLEO|nr:hypothetical protein M011DRAFT_477839 [Sporormia fimetaria CBS 119925]